MDVYDAAAWSAPAPLSESVGGGGERAGEVPRFHAGALASLKTFRLAGRRDGPVTASVTGLRRAAAAQVLRRRQRDHPPLVPTAQ